MNIEDVTVYSRFSLESVRKDIVLHNHRLEQSDRDLDIEESRNFLVELTDEHERRYAVDVHENVSIVMTANRMISINRLMYQSNEDDL